MSIVRFYWFGSDPREGRFLSYIADRSKVLFNGLCFRDNTDRKTRWGAEGETNMGDVMVIVALAVYIPMSMVYMFCREKQ